MVIQSDWVLSKGHADSDEANAACPDSYQHEQSHADSARLVSLCTACSGDRGKSEAGDSAHCQLGELYTLRVYSEALAGVQVPTVIEASASTLASSPR